MVSTERCLFLKDFLLHPSRIGSITPSSSQLTRKMLSGLPWEELNTIVELGAGTGVFTKYVMEHRKPDSRFLVIEQDTLMRRLLMKQFPQALFGTQNAFPRLCVAGLCRKQTVLSLGSLLPSSQRTCACTFLPELIER